MMKAYMNWSGGKDATMALYRSMLQKEFDIFSLLTTVNSAHNRVSMHGVRSALIHMQAEAIGIPLVEVYVPEEPSMETYEDAMSKAVQQMVDAGCTHSIFGDIFLEDLRIYREEKLREMNLTCVFPIWKTDTTELLKYFIREGFKAVIVCTNNAKLPKSFCGRLIDESFLNDLPNHVDPCGENGEYHSFVFDGPVFSRPVAFTFGEKVYKEYKAPGNEANYGFYFQDIIPA